MMEQSAEFSPCRKWRYELRRTWDRSRGYAMFIGLNPSTADETIDDPTVRRCKRYASDFGYGGLVMTNIFAYRATLPEDMKAQADPIGPENDEYLVRLAAGAGVILAAWGVHGAYLGRGIHVARMIPNLQCLKTTKNGHPGHPLYLPLDARPMPFQYSPLEAESHEYRYLA